MTDSATTLPLADGASTTPAEHLTPNQRALLRFKRNHPAVLSLIFVVVFFAIILVWPFASSVGPNTLSDAQFQAPSAHHWRGTDIHGRDVLARIM